MSQLLIAGLDGATWRVLDPLLAQGRLPVLARLCREGTRGDLASVWPPISAAAWASMLTGLNPGRHGVFDFRNLDMRHYAGHDERLTTSADIAAPMLFDHVGLAGSISYQVPLTYPPRPIHGVMVAGYPTPDRRRAYVSPPAWSARLEPLETHTADQVGRARPKQQLAIFRRSIERLTENVVALSRAVDWRLLMYVTGAPDGAQHRFFKFLEPDYPGVTQAERRRYGPLLGRVMEAVDASLGTILASLPEDTSVLVISDHGAVIRPRRAFHVNAWLAQEGWLQPRAGGPGRLAPSATVIEALKQRLPLADWAKRRLPVAWRARLARTRAGIDRIDWPRTMAYRVKLSHPIEGIQLNVRGRQPDGALAPDQFATTRMAIMEALARRPEIVDVRPREAVFAGPFADRAPDILFRLRPEVDGGAGLDHVGSDVPAAWLRAISGYHDLTGIVVASGPLFRQGTIDGASLLDIAPTALHALDLPVPDNLDGRVLKELFRQPRPVELGPPVAESNPSTTSLTGPEESGIEAALRALGYLE